VSVRAPVTAHAMVSEMALVTAHAKVSKRELEMVPKTVSW
jgi:hypothetical protein